MATAIDDGDEDLQRRIRLHRERRPRGWGTLEIGVLDEVLNAAEEWDGPAGLPHPVGFGEDEPALPEFDRFLTRAGDLNVPLLMVSDEVGLGVVPESEAGGGSATRSGWSTSGRPLRLEVHLCIAGIGIRIK